MKHQIYKKIINDAHRMIIKDAKKNDWMWFYNMHLKEMVKSAMELLKMYKADEHVVLIASWLHDASKLKIQNKKDTEKYHATHHLDSAKQAEEFLADYKITQAETRAIVNCILRHRNMPGYLAESMEEKIVVVADVLSHFNGIFYFTYFKFHPEDTMEEMAKQQLGKIEKDWSALEILPKSRKLVKDNYVFLKEMCESYFEEKELT